MRLKSHIIESIKKINLKINRKPSSWIQKLRKNNQNMRCTKILFFSIETIRININSESRVPID